MPTIETLTDKAIETLINRYASMTQIFNKAGKLSFAGSAVSYFLASSPDYRVIFGLAAISVASWTSQYISSEICEEFVGELISRYHDKTDNLHDITPTSP